MATNVCTRCNRPLKNPASVQHGMGPVCYGKYAAVLAAASAGPCGSKFDVVKAAREAGMVWIVDRNGAQSVTNYAEAVCAALSVEYGNARIIYRDSMGLWDELKHECGRFLGFAPARWLGVDVVGVAS